MLLLPVLALAWSYAPSPARGSKPAELESIGALTFGPPGVLFVGDSHDGKVVAYELDEREREPLSLNLEGLDGRIASLLGTSVAKVQIHDLAISPVSHDAYVSVSRGGGTGDARIKAAVESGRTPHLIRIDGEGKLSEVDLAALASTSARLEDVRPAGKNRWGHDRRAWNVLEMKFVDGTLFISGVSNEEWSSKIRRVDYPFQTAAESSALRIFHTAHGRWETDAPARVFTPYEKGGKKGILAGFSCTPLVDISLSDLETQAQVEGKTIAELGPGNHVLDMITVTHHGTTHFLLANHLHPFLALALDDFEGAKNLTRGTARAGIDRQPLAPADVTRLANLGSDRVVMLQKPEDSGGVNLVTTSVSELLGS
jgi:hypothetical protein